MSLLLKHARYLDATGDIVAGDILVVGDRIQDVGPQLKGSDVIDVGGRLVMTGLIDPHVHLREPGLVYKEDFLSGGKAALAGGYTSVFDMPNTLPPVIDLQTFEHKLTLAALSPVEVQLFFGATKTNLGEIAKLSTLPPTARPIGLKVFLGASTGNLLMDDYNHLEDIFHAYDGVVVVHAEDQVCLEACESGFEGVKTVAVHGQLRDPSCASLAVERALKVLERVPGGRLYFAHISTARELDLIRTAKQQGLHVFAEVTPHHLFLSEDDTLSGDNRLKMNPPLRTEHDVAALWQGIQEGIVDTIGTDHAPHLMSEKRKPYSEAPAGVPGLETALPLMLNAFAQGRVSLHRIQQLCSTNVSSIFGLQDRGALIYGKRADLTIIDLNLEQTVDEGLLQTKCRWSPFVGRKLKGWPVGTMIGGKMVYHHRSFMP